MRKIILVLLLAVVSSSAVAQWAKWFVVDSRQSFTMYADSATIRKAGGIAQMWDMSDAKPGKALGPFKESLSFKIERAYDCNGQRLQTLYVSWHSGHMGEGAILGSDSNIASWQPVMLGTIGEKLWQIACGEYRRHL